MAHADLRAFLALLEEKRELVRVKEGVSADLEISAVTDRVSKSPGGGRALLFESVQGHSMPVLINALGSVSRMKLTMHTIMIPAPTTAFTTEVPREFRIV